MAPQRVSSVLVFVCVQVSDVWRRSTFPPCTYCDGGLLEHVILAITCSWNDAGSPTFDSGGAGLGFRLGRESHAGGQHRGMVSGTASQADDRLVLEPWITPSMFESKPGWVVDEWTYGQYMATQNDTMGEITAHWNSWFEYGEKQR